MVSADDVYFEFGRTANLAQAFECEIGSALLVLEGNLRGLFDAQGPDEVRSILERIDRKTLGQVLRVAREKLTIDPQDEELFARALKERNQLMHGFFLREFPRFQSEAGRDSVVRSLRKMSELFEEARIRASELTDALTQPGIREQLPEILAKLRKNWEAA